MARTDSTPETETIVADETVETESEATETKSRERKPIPSVDDLIASFDVTGGGEKSAADTEREQRVARAEQVLKGAAIELSALANGTTEEDSRGKAIISIKTAVGRISKAILAVPDEALGL